MPYTAINGAQIYYEVTGTGIPVVFTHAGVADSRMWNGQATAFAEHYRVVRWDMRAFGNSEPVAGEFSDVGDLAMLIDWLSLDKVVLIGCSMGGGISMDYALEHPERTRALVMVGSAPSGLVLDLPIPTIDDEAEAAFKAREWQRLTEMLVHYWFDGEGRTAADMDAAQRALMVDMVQRNLELESRGLTKRVSGVSRSAAERLSELKIPVLVVYGDRDEAYIQQAADYMVEHLPNARKVLMSNTAHLPNLERSDEFNLIVLQFLKEVL